VPSGPCLGYQNALPDKYQLLGYNYSTSRTEFSIPDRAWSMTAVTNGTNDWGIPLLVGALLTPVKIRNN
jgi:hypothetical protein